MTTSPHESEKLRLLAVELAQEAGDLIRERPDTLHVTSKSSPTDAVTQMDAASEELLRRRLSEVRPDDAILGEECPDTPGTSGLTWVLDPIDGTVNYLYDSLQYAVSVAVVEGSNDPSSWAAVAGAVCRPSTGDTWSAAAGAGAFRGERRCQVRGTHDLGTALVATGFGYTVERRTHQAHVVSKVIPAVRDIRRGGSAALDLCAVADGSLDAYYEKGLGPWDHAAGALIATEAGAIVTDGRGGQPTSELIVAGGPAVHDALARCVNKAMHDAPGG